MRQQFRECGKRFLRIFLVGVAALCFACLYVQEDREFRSSVKQLLCDFFSKSYSCTMSARDMELDLLSGHVELKGVFTYGKNWSWFAPSMGATWSWQDVFSSGGFALEIQFKDVRIYSDGECSLSGISIPFIPHVQQWLQQSQFPIKIIIDTFSLEGWGIFFESNRPFAERLLSVVHCQLNVAKHEGEWQTRVSLSDGGIWCGMKEVGRSHKGTLLFCAPLDHAKPKHLHSSLTIRAPILKSLFPAFNLSFDYQSGVWKYAVESAEKTGNKKGFLDTIFCKGMLVQQDKKIVGSGSLHAYGREQAIYNGVYNQEKQELKARLEIKQAYAFSKTCCLRKVAAESTWVVDERGKHDWKISGVLENKEEIKGSVQQLPVVLYGTHDRGVWRTACSSLGTFLHIKGASFWQGMLAGYIHIGKQGLSVKIKIENGQIPLPGTYAVLTNASCKALVDVRNKKIKIAHSEIKTTRGSCSVTRGSLAWHQKNDEWYICLPFNMKLTPFGFKSVLSLDSLGAGVFVARPGDPIRITGLIALAKGFLQGNIFSALFIERLLGRIFYGADLESMRVPQQKSFGSVLRSFLASAEFDLQVATEQPHKVKIPLLSGFLKGRLHLQGSLGFPRITGSLSVAEGVIHLPYRPLFVTEGDILFDMPRRPIPDLSFVASNEIQQHVVSLCARGPLDSPRISVTSDPELDVRCCATLLTGGSVDGTPAIAYSASLKQLIQELFFADVLPEVSTDNFSFKKTVKPGVTIISRLGSGLGISTPGSCVGMTVEYGDRWSASVEKNVDLPTATAAEIEYHISPESLVFINRDELGLFGIGGEWAHRWES